MKPILLASTLGVVLAAPAHANAVALRDSVPHLTTSGEARAEVVPDQADLRLSVRHERPTAREATAATVEEAAALVAAVKTRGVEAKDIRTSLDVSAQYDTVIDPRTKVGRRVFRAYAAAEALTVRVRDLAVAGALARELIDKGANGFEGIEYSFANETELRRRLDGEAMKDALAQARTYTDAVGARLGRILQIGGEDEGQPSRRKVFATPAAAPAPGGTREAIPIEPGVETITESVTVVWEIEGKAP